MIRHLPLPLAALVLAGSVAFAQPSSNPSQNEPVKGRPLPQPNARASTAPGDFAWPERIQNAQVLQADIGAERLRRTMVGFSRQLGVRCTHCHVGPEGAPLSQLDFVSDANPRKNIARGMLRMNQRLNGELLPAIVGPVTQGAPARVTCFTCHRGSPQPATQPPAPPGPPGAAPPPPQQPPRQAGERG
jgi:hypothetical protein